VPEVLLILFFLDFISIKVFDEDNSYEIVPIPVAALSKTQVCVRSTAEIVGSNPTGGMDVRLL
jgi:hypothetical protein